MRVIRSMGCVSGRLSNTCSSFGPGLVADALEEIEGDAYDNLPSVRAGAHKPLIVPPVIYNAPVRVLPKPTYR